MDLHPTVCNLCGGPVIYTSNAEIYGREYGSGKCYLCTQCRAYVGTHKPRPREALGILADARMRAGKMACHSLFDSLWKGKGKAGKKRQALYAWLAKQMEIPVGECHFGYFTLEQLKQAYRILEKVSSKEIRYDSCGNIIFEEAQK